MNNYKDQRDVLIAGSFLIFSIFLACIILESGNKKFYKDAFIKQNTQIEEFREKAIKKGCAEWQLNPKTGNPEFKWN